ncbi:hypothetical protein QMP26_21085 [Enterocloster clostridioformis]|uniref:DUF5839 family protein n=1 Tax=Enterocloster clostridioformis TaxID=1531 RepID=UPI0026774976|nr:DUF5839 family protein [Enterocloster clostridioformis]
MARALNNIYKMGMEYSTENFVFTPEIVKEAHQRVYGKLLVNEGGKPYQWEIPLKLIDKIALGDRVVVETFYGPQRVTVKEIIPLTKRTGRKVRRIEEKPN